MTIIVNFKPFATPGYVPRKALTLHNVASVHDQGPSMVEVRMIFTDDKPTYDHVVSVTIKPSQEE